MTHITHESVDIVQHDHKKGGYGNYSKRGRYDDGQSAGGQSQESSNPQEMLAQMKQMMNQVSCYCKTSMDIYPCSTDAADAKTNDADDLRPTSDVPSDATNAGFFRHIFQSYLMQPRIRCTA